MIKNFDCAPFPPFAPLAGLAISDGKRVLGRGMSAASDDLVLWLRQGGRCFYCDDPMIVPQTKRDARNKKCFSQDHILPRRVDPSRLGPKVGACMDCNNGRGAMLAHDFILLAAMREGIRVGGLK